MTIDNLVYPRERVLGTITLLLGLTAWAALILGTFGIALVFLALGFIAYLFTHSALVAHIRGNGVQLTRDQFPELHEHFVACCERLGMKERPQAYVLNGNGSLNAFATKFLGTQFVVLLSDVVDAMDRSASGVRFYIGHELGHLRMKHLRGQLLRWPALWLPLLGAAYSRARESTCDRHGAACCDSPADAAHALAALSTGPARWQKLNMAAYLEQLGHSRGFWMSFHELIAGYPWLTKRVSRVVDPNTALPSRSPLSYVLAAIVPYAGRLGGGFALLIVVYLIGVLAAVALPAYMDYTARVQVSAAVTQSQHARDLLSKYYETTKQVPPSLEAAGAGPALPDGTPIALDPKGMVLTLSLKSGQLILRPSLDAQGRVVWTCANGKGLRPSQLPVSCRQTGQQEDQH